MTIVQRFGPPPFIKQFIKKHERQGNDQSKALKIGPGLVGAPSIIPSASVQQAPGPSFGVIDTFYDDYKRAIEDYKKALEDSQKQEIEDTQDTLEKARDTLEKAWDTFVGCVEDEMILGYSRIGYSFDINVIEKRSQQIIASAANDRDDPNEKQKILKEAIGEVNADLIIPQILSSPGVIDQGKIAQNTATKAAALAYAARWIPQLGDGDSAEQFEALYFVLANTYEEIMRVHNNQGVAQAILSEAVAKCGNALENYTVPLEQKWMLDEIKLFIGNKNSAANAVVKKYETAWI
jgi:hypothetical protein